MDAVPVPASASTSTTVVVRSARYASLIQRTTPAGVPSISPRISSIVTFAAFMRVQTWVASARVRVGQGPFATVTRRR